MIALLAPRSHCIAVKQTHGWTVLRADGSQEFHSDADLECDHTFRDNGDTQVVNVSSLEEASDELTASMAEMDALDLLLLSLDPTLSEETRACCVEELEPLLAEQRVVDSLNSLMSAKPLPEMSDLGGAVRLSLKTHQSLTAKYLQQLNLRQPAIARVRQGWDELPDDLFDSPAERSRFEGACLQAGVFNDFTDAVFDELPSGELILSCMPKLAPYQLSRVSTVLKQWGKVGVSTSRQQISQKTFSEAENVERVEKGKKPQRKIRVPRESIDAIRVRIDEDKEAIVDALIRRDSSLLEDRIARLRGFHEVSGAGDRTHACKSFCDLAARALELNWADAAFTLVTEAIRSNPNDPFARSGRAEVLKALGRFDDALNEYDNTIKIHPHNPVARNGRAEVLKALGRFDDALHEYNETIKAHPHNPVARNGRAEVLKALGRFDDALDEYDNTIRVHPNDAIAKTGRAEVLTALGRLDEALNEFDNIIKAHPHNPVAKTGRAEVLTALRRPDEALSEYDHIIKAHPHNPVAKTGRAEALKALGRFDEALRVYDDVIKDYPHDLFARNGRAEVLMAIARFDDALHEYDSIIKAHPHDSVAKAGRAEVLKALEWFENAPFIYDSIAKQNPNDPDATSGPGIVSALIGANDAATSHFAITRQVWIARQIAGMANLHREGLNSEERIFIATVSESPWVIARSNFESALRVLRLCQ